MPALDTYSTVPKTVEIPSGCFQMGSFEKQPGYVDNENQHRVCINRFKLAVHETTIGQFKKFIEATGYKTDAESDYEIAGCWSFDKDQAQPWDWWNWANWKTPLKDIEKTDDLPVTCVSWNDINKYIDWLNQTSGHRYRLPTEAEWEYAARGESGNSYYWGNNPDIACRYANVADNSKLGAQQWPDPHRCEDGYFFVAPVKRFLPNKFGLYDMLGNAWEWTCSKYEQDYRGQEQLCIDQAPANDSYIAVRGGGWNADPSRTRVAFRNWDDPWTRLASWGFRLVQID